MTDRSGAAANPAGASTQPLISLRLPADHFYQGAIRRLMADAAHQAGFPADAAAAIAMAVDEACANVVEHGYRETTIHPAAIEDSCQLELQVDDRADRLVISIRDRASHYHLPADLAPVGAPRQSRAIHAAESTIRERGMGLIIIRRVMDDVQLDPMPGGGNCLRLIKYKAAHAAKAAADAQEADPSLRPEFP